MTAMQGAGLALALSVVVGGAVGCGAEADACDSPVVATAVDRATAEDVTAILERSCALGGCHLRAPGAGGLVLERSTAAWRTAVVNVPSQQHPAMALVAPGDPDGSWLVVKIFGTFCGATCARGVGCGTAMPPGEPLSDSARATIVAWIADGAR